ncbi:MAG: recombinase family protein [Opitutaceae bacterium]|nr:recombinase family protein [Opitutaceae bacterium]
MPATPPRPQTSSAIPVRSLPAAIYARVSTDDQVGGRFDSCDNQAAVCRDVISRTKGWHEVACLTDAAYSGGTMNRPGIQALKRLIEAGEVKVLVVFKLERLSRNIDEFGPFRAFLQKHGCELVSATEDISESEPEGRLKNNIIMAVSDFERRNVAKKVRIKLREQARRGIWNGGMVPLGYDYDLNTQKLTPNAAEAALVRRVFEQAAQLVPLTDIANALNAEGHRTKPRIFARRDGTSLPVGGNHFRSDGLRLILTNPIYRGCIRFGGEEYAGRHEALVKADVWERANAAVKTLPPRERPSVIVERDRHGHILKGVVFCAHCQRALIPHDSGKKDPAGRPYRYYDCGQVVRKSRDQSCPVGRIAAGALESVVLGFLTKLGQHPEVTRTALADSRSSQRIDREPLRTSLADTEKALTEINRQVENLVEAIAAGGADLLGEELKQRVLTLRERRQELIVKREQVRQDLRGCDEAMLNEKRILAAIDRLGELLPRMKPEEQKQLVSLLIERIDIRAGREVGHGAPQRPLQLEIKVHIPELVEGMEQKVIVGDGLRHTVAPRQRTLGLSMKARLGNQGAFGASIIFAPFEHRVLPVVAKTPQRSETPRHPIHRAVAWHRELQRDPTLEKQAIAKREHIAPGSVTHHLKLIKLIPEIQEFLRGLKEADAVHYFSLRKMRRLAELPAEPQTTQFQQMKRGFKMGIG